MTNTELNQETFDQLVSTLASKGARRMKIVFTTIDNKTFEFASKTNGSNLNDFTNVLTITDSGVSSFIHYEENPIPERIVDKNKYITKHKFCYLPFSYIYSYHFEYETQRVETVINEDNNE